MRSSLWRPGFGEGFLIAFVSSMLALYASMTGLIQYGIVMIATALYVLWEGSKSRSDPTMGAMIGGTFGGLLGSAIYAWATHLCQGPMEDCAMVMMMYSMAGMIGGTLGGGWRQYFNR